MKWKALDCSEKIVFEVKPITVPGRVPVYVKMNTKIRVDYFTEINDILKNLQLSIIKSWRDICKIKLRKIFSELDLSDPYLQMSLKEKSTNLLTINSQGFVQSQ